MKAFEITLTVDENTVNRIHDCVHGVFGVSLSQEQLEILIKKGTAGLNIEEEDFVEDLVYTIIKMQIPTYGSSEEYKRKFWAAINEKKEEFLNYLNED